jgi:hypothetical protein
MYARLFLCSPYFGASLRPPFRPIPMMSSVAIWTFRNGFPVKEPPIKIPKRLLIGISEA